MPPEPALSSAFKMMPLACALLALGASAQPSGDGGTLTPVRPGSVRFVAFGDQGKGNAAQRAVGSAVAKVCASQGCDFVGLLGDNFYPSGVSSVTDPQWQSAFVAPYAEVNAPFYAALGNHDYGYGGTGADFQLSRYQIAYSQVNPKWRMPASHYHFHVGDVEFFVADTNRSFYYLDAGVRADFAKWMSASTSPWKIVLGHHNLRSNGPHGNAGNYSRLPSVVPIAAGGGVRAFLEDDVCGRADAYICGHEHILEWLQGGCTRLGSSKATELLISGGGASTTSIRKESSEPTYWNAAVPGFLYVVIEGSTFTGTYYDQHGTQLFTRSFTRS